MSNVKIVDKVFDFAKEDDDFDTDVIVRDLEMPNLSFMDEK